MWLEEVFWELSILLRVIVGDRVDTRILRVHMNEVRRVSKCGRNGDSDQVLIAGAAEVWVRV